MCTHFIMLSVLNTCARLLKTSLMLSHMSKLPPVQRDDPPPAPADAALPALACSFEHGVRLDSSAVPSPAASCHVLSLYRQMQAEGIITLSNHVRAHFISVVELCTTMFICIVCSHDRSCSVVRRAKKAG